MKNDIEGILMHERGELAVKTDDGKIRLLYNLFDGYSRKRVRITVEEVEKKEEKEEK